MIALKINLNSCRGRIDDHVHGTRLIALNRLHRLFVSDQRRGFRHTTAAAITKLLFTKFHLLEQMTTLPGLRILSFPECFCDAKAANFVLESRTF